MQRTLIVSICLTFFITKNLTKVLLVETDDETSKNGEDYLEFWRKTKGKDKGSRDYNDYSETIRCRCPKIYMPVCGTDEKTYLSKCVMKCAGEKMKHFGRCDNLQIF